jgi:hypothetical protein
MTPNPQDAELIRLLQEQELEYVKDLPPPPRREPPTIHFTELPDMRPGDILATEYNHYRRVVGQLLAEGHEGKWLLLENEEIIGIWDTQEEADQVRVERFLMQAVLMKQILTREPILRNGYNRFSLDPVSALYVRLPGG